MGHTQSSAYLAMHPRFGGMADGTGSLFPALATNGTNYNASYTGTPALRRSQTNLTWKTNGTGGNGAFDATAAFALARPLTSQEKSNVEEVRVTSSDKTMLCDLDTIKVSPVFAAVRNDVNTRFMPQDWLTSNQSNFCASDRVRGGAELMRLDASRLCREVCDKTNKNQAESTKRLGDRMEEIKYWKKEMQNELDNMIEENKKLECMFGCVEKALAETDEPLRIARQCLAEREMRNGIDLVHDNVEVELLKEVDTIQRIQDDLRQHVHDARNQAAMNNALQLELECDIADKFAALGRDTNCFGMRNTSGGLKHYNGIENVDNTISDPETWVKYTSDKVRRSQAMRAASQGVRDSIQQLLMKQAEALKNQWEATNHAFSIRLREYMDAKHKLETHLARVLQEIFDTEKSLEMLKKCLLDKDAPLKVAETRMMTRSDRPNMEACKDKAQHRLVYEIHEIKESSDDVRAKILEAEDTLQHLLRTKMSLEADLTVKNNSIFIDRERCMGLRKSYNMAPRSHCC